MRYKAIIFDMDGTIIDTEHIWKEAIKDLLNCRGIEVNHELSEELQDNLRGRALTESCTFLKIFFDLTDSLEALIQEKSNRANALYPHKVRFIPGFEEFHKKVINRKLSTGLATNASQETVDITDRTLNLSQFFGPHIYSIAHVNYKGKPDPAIYLHAAEQLGVDPKECIAIEDSERGVQAARAAGMYCIGINTSNNKRQLKDAHHIIDKYHEIDLEKLLKK